MRRLAATWLVVAAIAAMACGRPKATAQLGAASGQGGRAPSAEGQQQLAAADRDQPPGALSYWCGSLASLQATDAFAAAQPWRVHPCGEVTSVIVPHHFVAAPLIAAALDGVERPVRTVVLLTPDHRNASPHPVSTSLAQWRTRRGRILPARRLIAQLVDSGLVAVDERGFAREHAVADVVPLIEKAFPQARLVPLRFRGIRCASGADVARRLGHLLARHLPPDALLIASVDFVHDKPRREAEKIDRRSVEALSSLKPERACNVEVDSPLALVTLLAHAQAAGASQLVHLQRADSHSFGASGDDKVVSYLTGYFAKGGPRPVSVLAAGDIMLGRSLTANMRVRGDFRYPLSRVAAALRSADLTLANLEAQLIEECPTKRRGLTLCADPRVIATLELAGVDVVSVANNHALDFGPEGLATSVSLLRRAGIAVAGYDGPALLQRRGMRFAVLGYDAVRGPFRPTRMARDIAAAGQQADAVVVMMHWGREGHGEPNALQRRLADRAAAAGASLIVGAHPHAVQPLVRLDDTTVAFSLGNFVFDQREPAAARRGALGVFSFCGGSVADATLAPVTLSRDGVPRFGREGG